MSRGSSYPTSLARCELDSFATARDVPSPPVWHGSDRRPAALFIAPITPSDRDNGLAMRTGFLLSSYAQRFDVDLVVVPIAGETREAIASFPTCQLRRSIVLPLTRRDTQFTLLSLLVDQTARLAAFRDYGKPSITAALTANVCSNLAAFSAQKSYSLIHISRLYLAPLARPWTERRRGPCPTLVLDADEDDANAYRRLANLYRKSGHEEKAGWAYAEADAFTKCAAEWLNRFDVVLASSSEEVRALRRRGKHVCATTVPNVAPPIDSIRTLKRRGGHRDIVFVGNMSYLPNIDAVRWFALSVWPRLRRMFAGRLRFIIAGNSPPREVLDLARQPGIVVMGTFPQVGSLYRDASLVVIPIRAGGGTRIKLLEAASYCVPVVSTSFGAYGSGFRSGRELLLADNSRDFADSCARLLQDFALASRVVAGARRKIHRDFDSAICSRRFLGKIERICTRE